MKFAAQLPLLLGLAVVTVLAVASVSAQNAKWQIDAGHSTASIFLAQSGDTDPGINVAVAIAAGTMELDSGDPLQALAPAQYNSGRPGRCASRS